MDGDIVVQDCFQLMAALLRSSPPNQLMFRETGFLAQLPAMLRLPESGGAAPGQVGQQQHAADGLDHHGLAPQKVANLVAALDVVLALLPPAAADPAAPVCASAAENRQALLQRGLLGVLEGLALQGGGAPDDAVRAQASRGGGGGGGSAHGRHSSSCCSKGTLMLCLGPSPCTASHQVRVHLLPARPCRPCCAWRRSSAAAGCSRTSWRRWR